MVRIVRRLAILCVLAMALVVPQAAVAAAPSATMNAALDSQWSYGADTYCAIQWIYQWTGFKNAQSFEFRQIDETSNVEMTGWQAWPIFRGDVPRWVGGSSIVLGHTFRVEGRLLASGNRVIDRSFASASIDSASCPS